VKNAGYFGLTLLYTGVIHGICYTGVLYRMASKKLIALRVDEEVKVDWESRARAEGMSLSKWIRVRCSGPAKYPEPGPIAGVAKEVAPKDRYLDGQDSGPAGYEKPKGCCEVVFMGGKRVHGKGCDRG